MGRDPFHAFKVGQGAGDAQDAVVGAGAEVEVADGLLEQAFVKNPDITVGKLVAGAGAGVAGFVRFEVGEGIAVEKVDFAQEVAAQLKG